MPRVDRLALEVAYNLGATAASAGLPVRDVIRKFAYGFCDLPPVQKRSEDGTTAGDHGIPELASAELDFKDKLSAGRRDAVKAIKELVDRLYDEQRGWQNIDPYSIDEVVDEWKASAVRELATHPMSAYLLGQMFATEALDLKTHRPLNPEDRQTIDFLSQYSLNEIDARFDDIKYELRNQLIAGIQRQQSPHAVARAMASILSDYDTNWDAIAITETSRAESQGRLQEYQDAGEEWVVGSSAHDARVCDDCRRLIDGQKVRLAETIGRSNYGLKRAEWLAVIPVHPRCRCVWLPAAT